METKCGLPWKCEPPGAADVWRVVPSCRVFFHKPHPVLTRKIWDLPGKASPVVWLEEDISHCWKSNSIICGRKSKKTSSSRALMTTHGSWEKKREKIKIKSPALGVVQSHVLWPELWCRMNKSTVKTTPPEYAAHNILRVVIATVNVHASPFPAEINTDLNTKGPAEAKVCSSPSTKYIYLCIFYSKQYVQLPTKS